MVMDTRAHRSWTLSQMLSGSAVPRADVGGDRCSRDAGPNARLMIHVAEQLKTPTGDLTKESLSAAGREISGVGDGLGRSGRGVWTLCGRCPVSVVDEETNHRGTVLTN